MYIDDCVEGLLRLMASDFREPLNLGTDELITINGLVDLISDIAGKTVTKRHDTTKAQGVRGRNSDNSLLRQVLGWEPSISLREGLSKTYPWIESEVRKNASLEVAELDKAA
jgi:GDP-D-mannose 3', 5'-epimerase